jgi:hypothetical protein
MSRKESGQAADGKFGEHCEEIANQRNNSWEAPEQQLNESQEELHRGAFKAFSKMIKCYGRVAALEANEENYFPIYRLIWL